LPNISVIIIEPSGVQSSITMLGEIEGEIDGDTEGLTDGLIDIEIEGLTEGDID